MPIAGAANYDPLSHIAPRFLRDGKGRIVASRNERDLLRLIWNNPGIARSELTEPLELTQQSLHRLAEKLKERGMIAFGEPDGGRAGARSPALVPDPHWCMTAGISVNVGAIDVVLMSFGEILEIEHLPEEGPELVNDLDRIEAALDRMLAARNAGRDAILGVGLGVAGYRMQAGRGFNAPQPLLRWSLIELAPLIAGRLGLPVWADNGANTAALAEASFGVGRNVANFAYISHNFGYGGGLIADGRIFRGHFGNAAEISGLFTQEESLARPALQLLLEHLRNAARRDLTLHALIHNFSPEWPGVLEWVNKVTPAHNRAVNALHSIFDPQLIVLGGEIPAALAAMLLERTLFLAGLRHGVSRPPPEVRIAKVTTAPTALGAALLPLFETVL